MPRPKGIVCKFCGGEFFKASFSIHQKKCEKLFAAQHTECEACGRNVHNTDYMTHKADCRPSPRSKARVRKAREARAAAAEARLRPRCEECEEHEAVLRCEQCEQIMCGACSTQIHKKGARAKHARSALPGKEGQMPDAAAAAAPAEKEVIDEEVIREACNICGRKFATDRIGTHERICKRSAAKNKRKKKVKDGATLRLKGTEFEAFHKNAQRRPPTPPDERKAKGERWREEREQFRSLIEANVPTELLAKAEARRAAEEAKRMAVVKPAAAKPKAAPPPPAADAAPAEVAECKEPVAEAAAARAAARAEKGEPEQAAAPAPAPRPRRLKPEPEPEVEDDPARKAPKKSPHPLATAGGEVPNSGLYGPSAIVKAPAPAEAAKKPRPAADARRRRESEKRARALERSAAKARAGATPEGREAALQRARERALERKQAKPTARERLAALSSGKSSVSATAEGKRRGSGVRSTFTDRAKARERGKAAAAAMAPPKGGKKRATAPKPATPAKPRPVAGRRSTAPPSGGSSAAPRAASSLRASRLARLEPAAKAPPSREAAAHRRSVSSPPASPRTDAVAVPRKKVSSMDEYLERERIRRRSSGRSASRAAAVAASAPKPRAKPKAKPEPEPRTEPKAAAGEPRPSRRAEGQAAPAPAPGPVKQRPEGKAPPGEALFIPAGPSNKNPKAPPKLSEKPVPHKQRKTVAEKTVAGVGVVPVSRRMKAVVADGKVTRVLAHTAAATADNPDKVRAARSSFLARVAEQSLAQ